MMSSLNLKLVFFASCLVAALFAPVQAQAQGPATEAPRQRITVPDNATVEFFWRALKESRQAADTPILESAIESGPPPEVSLDFNIQFDFDSATLSRSAVQLLDTLAQALIAIGDKGRFRIEGHTDARGTDNYNDALSWRRAQAVTNFLTSRKIPAAQLETVGYGEQRPIREYPVDHEDQRRVEILAIK
jgi:outer membrane protein OmpA-like peptidoglycan-associated protein